MDSGDSLTVGLEYIGGTLVVKDCRESRPSVVPAKCSHCFSIPLGDSMGDAPCGETR